MKWLSLLLVIVLVAVGLWKFGLIQEFLKPWAGWANWIGYFQ
jgi:hypothetical protein